MLSPQPEERRRYEAQDRQDGRRDDRGTKGRMSRTPGGGRYERVLPEELLSVLAVAEGFGASGAGGGERARQIAGGQAGGEIGAAHVLRKKAGIEAVACADGVHHVRFDRRTGETFLATLRRRSLSADFYHDHRHNGCQPGSGSFQVFGAGNLSGFALIGQENIHITKSLCQSALPGVVGIVVGVERDSQASGFQFLEKLGDPRLKATLQIERRKMEVPRIGEVGKIQISKAQFAGGAQIGDHVAPGLALQDDSQAGFGCARSATYFGDIGAGGCEAIQGNLPEWVVADARDVPYAASEGGKIVRDNSRGAAQGKHHALGQQFALGWNLVRQAVEDQVELELTSEGDVKARHVVRPSVQGRQAASKATCD